MSIPKTVVAEKSVSDTAPLEVVISSGELIETGVSTVAVADAEIRATTPSAGTGLLRSRHLR